MEKVSGKVLHSIQFLCGGGRRYIIMYEDGLRFEVFHIMEAFMFNLMEGDFNS